MVSTQHKYLEMGYSYLDSWKIRTFYDYVKLHSKRVKIRTFYDYVKTTLETSEDQDILRLRENYTRTE